jgi:hypothetical protein
MLSAASSSIVIQSIVSFELRNALFIEHACPGARYFRYHGCCHVAGETASLRGMKFPVAVTQ